jgi:hypothetical protein
LNEAKEVLWMIFPSDEDPALPLDPGKEARPASAARSVAGGVGLASAVSFASSGAARHLDAILT